ncbi:MAG: cation diffusion facilitator family transporter [Candidatus Tumulicola sp.]
MQADRVEQRGGSESPRTVVVAILVNVAIAVVKVVASFITGSAAMTAEAIHSVVDAGNSALLLIGMHRSAQPANARHPFGYGREIYFWSLVVAVVIFGAGGVAAIAEGVSRFFEPYGLQNIAVNYAVLGIALVFETVSWRVAYRGIRKEYPGISPFSAARRSKDPGLFVVLFEDTAAILGLLIALVIGTILASIFPSYHFDAIASVLIGLLLVTTAVVLMNKTRSLLVGESADEETLEGIRALLKADPRVASVHRILSAQMAPGDLLLNLDLRFDSSLAGGDIAAAIQAVEKTIRNRYPDVKEIFVEAQAFSSPK